MVRQHTYHTPPKRRNQRPDLFTQGRPSGRMDGRKNRHGDKIPRISFGRLLEHTEGQEAVRSTLVLQEAVRQHACVGGGA